MQGYKSFLSKSQDQPFCFWDVKSVEDVYFICFNMAIIIILLGIAIFRIFKTFKFINRQVKVIYMLIVLWGTVFFAQYIYGLSIFFLILNYQDGPKDIPSESRIYSLFDAIPGYTIQTIFYYIWVLMFANIKNISLKLELPLTKFQTIGYPIISFYFYFRFLVKITAWILALTSSLNQLWFYNLINIGVLLTDAIILNVALIVSLPIFLKRIDSFKLSNSQVQKKKLKNEYIFMIVASGLRFILDLQLLIIEPLTLVKVNSCINKFYDHLEFALEYNLFGTMIMQFIPIFIILKLYHLKKQDRQNFQKMYHQNKKYVANQSRSSVSSIHSIQQKLSEN